MYIYCQINVEISQLKSCFVSARYVSGCARTALLSYLNSDGCFTDVGTLVVGHAKLHLALFCLFLRNA